MVTDKRSEFMDLYAPLNSRFSAYCMALTNDEDNAKDLMNDCILIAFEKFESIDKKESFLFFLFKVASNLYKQSLRRNKFWGVFDSMEVTKKVSNSSLPDTLTDVTILFEALDKMPIKYKSPLVLFELSGLTIKEIAEIENITESGVKSRLTRGREMLSSLLGVTPLKKEKQVLIKQFIFTIY
jgi:RNA polymerase sigma-70 factor (ECF subfamily)